MLGGLALGAAVAATGRGVAAPAGTASSAAPQGPAGLASLTGTAQPITREERLARIAHLQALMREHGVAALLVESGSTLDYFTGVSWHLSERVTAAIIPVTGPAVVVTPFFERPSIQEMLQIPAEMRPWQEDEDPFALIAAALRGRELPAGPVAVDAYTRFYVIDALNRALRGARALVPGDALVQGCRMFKSPAELALMQVANDVTMAAMRYVRAQVRAGMTARQMADLMDRATVTLGGEPQFSLVLLNEASAFPHGSKLPQSVREGSVILMDCGCAVHGYQSDITRTWVFGTPTARQREVWDTVKRGQELALQTARIGVPTGRVDAAVREFYEGRGWGRNYALPGLSHRTGHGIGLDVHEAPYLVRNSRTVLRAGMCFSDEPGIYIPGEFGVRLEDCWHMTDSGPKLFSGLAKSIDEPI
ncbi:MAG: aminopeptidase P family protein [Proteobacteria bacterium]|nr:aminopeptidase P family protein [Pseudomonadota bacterium]